MTRTSSKDDLQHPRPRRLKKRQIDLGESSGTIQVEPSAHRRASTSSRDTMRRSSSPHDAIHGAHLTKTGRISKAAKGQPVHHCECGKTYTRAEHLRRHKQNHKPGEFPCDVSGCERAFYREDLLVRHKSRHHDDHQSPTPLLPSSGGVPQPPNSHSLLPTMPESVSNDINTGLPPSLPLASDVAAGQSVAEPAQRQSRKGYIPITEMRAGTDFDFVIDGIDGGLDYSQANSLWISQPEYSFESTYNTPEPCHQYHDQLQMPASLDINQPWVCATPNVGLPRSPTSAGSKAPVPQWRGTSPRNSQLHTPTSIISNCGSGDHAAPRSNLPFMDLSAVRDTFSPENRDLQEEQDLMTPTSAPQATNFGPNQYRHQPDNEQRYLAAYWESVHPSWPVVHRPTFDFSYSSPLLRASMLSLGASTIGQQVDSANACIIHRRCLKVLRKRTAKTSHSYRTCDLQAILLVELFSAFKSRRPPFQLSRYFEDSFAAVSLETVDAIALPSEIDQYFEVFNQDIALGSEDETKQRLLAAYYLLDRLHATLFDRSTARPNDFDSSALILSQPLIVWDTQFSGHAIPGNMIGDHQPVTTLCQAADLTHGSFASQSASSDVFTSMLLLAYNGDTTTQGCSSSEQTNSSNASQHSAEPSPLIDLTSATLNLCSKSPLRSLLAVAGESWVMGEKLNSRHEYQSHQRTLRQWAVSAISAQALKHALEILKLHRKHLISRLLFHEWSLHLAALVLWAKAYAARDSAGQLRLAIPSANSVEAIVERQELEDIVSRVVQKGAEGKHTWAEARGVLMWAKARMEKTGSVRFCGVVSGAVDVLGRLGGRGDEDGWF